jgi:hypothetical protein
MKSSSSINYIDHGRRWARGLNKLEDRGIREFRIILILTTLLGCLAGLGVAVWVQLPWYGYIIGGGLGIFAGFLVGRGFAQLWVPHRWEEMLGAELERQGPTKQHVRQTEGFRKEQTRPHPDIFTTLFTLGMIRKRRLDMEPDRLYLADVGFNEIFIYDTQLARDNRKLFWKLNVRRVPVIKVLSIPYRLKNTTVEATGIPVMGENDEDSRRSLWIKVSYRVWVQLEIERERVRQFVQIAEPMRVVKNIVLTAAREVLPFQRYEDVVLAATSNQLGQRVKMYLDQAELGLRIAGVHIEEIEGSKELDESLQESFNRFRLAEDRQAIAVSLSQMDDHLIQLMHEYEGNQAALEFRSRAATRMVEGLLAAGIPAKQLYGVTQAEARALDKNESLPELMTEAVEAIEGEQEIKMEPDCPDIPPDLTHSERLEWEAQELEKRLPHIFRGFNIAEDRFEFDLASGQLLVIIFPAPKTTRPHVYIDSQSWTEKYRALWDDVYDVSYERVTVCELYHQTLKLLEKA